jgi:hypothetical protein
LVVASSINPIKTSLKTIRSTFILAGLLFAGASTVFAPGASAQTSTIKIGNDFGSDVKIRSVQVECKDWNCKVPDIGTFRMRDSLAFEFTSVTGRDETAYIHLDAEGGRKLIIEAQLRAVPTSSVESPFASGLYVSPVWPNPAKDNLNVNIHGISGRNVVAFVYDLLGKEVFQQAVTNEGHLRLELPAMADGRYYFMLRDGMETLAMQEIKIGK